MYVQTPAQRQPKADNGFNGTVLSNYVPQS